MANIVRWNLVIFGAVLMVMLGVVVYFALRIITPGVVVGNEELVIGAVFAMVTTSIGFVGGYATGVQQALTAPSSPAPEMTEETALEMVKIAAREK